MTMTSTLLQRPTTTTKIEKQSTKTTATKIRRFTTTAKAAASGTASGTTATTAAAMAWSNEKLRFSCIDNIGLKQLWKLIALDTTTTTATTTTSHGSGTSSSSSSASAKQQGNRNSMLPLPTTAELEHQQAHSNNNYKNNINNNHEQQIPYDNDNCENLADYLTLQRAAQAQLGNNPNRMSLLKFLAINALELSAPASPVLLQHQQKGTQIENRDQSKPQGWMQLSGHPESIVPTTSGIVRKRIVGLEDSEVHAYQLIFQEPQTAQIVPGYFGTQELNGEHFIELQDLLAGFKDPCVMDIKMGCRTFLETEVSNKTLRPDLYQKMMAVDASAPTAAEHEAQAITKLRYMLFRESLSSSHSKGFRIEALRLRGRAPLKDLKTCRTNEQITQTIEQFLGARKSVQKDLIKRLKHMRLVMEQSSFFNRHEIIGSSIFIVYDNERVGAWLIDFAKSRQLPPHLSVNHRSHWTPGNREEGLLKGMDELIHSFETVYARSSSHRGCLKM